MRRAALASLVVSGPARAAEGRRLSRHGLGRDAGVAGRFRARRRSPRRSISWPCIRRCSRPIASIASDMAKPSRWRALHKAPSSRARRRFSLSRRSTGSSTPQPVEHGGVGHRRDGDFDRGRDGALSLFQRMVVARTSSLAIGADRIHYFGDVVTNLGVVVGIVLVDAIRLAAGRSHRGHRSSPAFLRWSALACVPPELRPADGSRTARQTSASASKPSSCATADVRSLHDLRTRAAGISTFIQLHIELDPAISLTRAHEVSDRRRGRYPGAFPRTPK